MNPDNIYQKIKKYYPLRYIDNLLPKYLIEYFKVLEKIQNNISNTRIPGKFGKEYYPKLINKYTKIPQYPQDPLLVSKRIVNDFFRGILRWRSPYLEHNVGAPVNTVASAMYSLALDENIYNIDDGLAGNALAAEMTMSRIMSSLAKLDKPGVGFFTFGGTATNLYGSKMGLKKCAPDSGKKGLPKNIVAFATEDAHFTHALSSDWLGLGTDNLIIIKAGSDKRSDIHDAKEKIDYSLRKGKLISSIILNGGTMYNHTVDQISQFVSLRDEMVNKYSLGYKPHIHVDSVIGWTWLFFNFYDFGNNPLNISKEALKKIQQQNSLISQIKFADSWGADFHKSVGGCPVDTSFIMFNNADDIKYISKTENPILETHQLATEFTYFSPADYTLETSRTGGTALAALASLHSLGYQGYQRNLANLIEGTCILRDILRGQKQIFLVNDSSLGFVTMVRTYPPEFIYDPIKFNEFINTSRSPNNDFIEYVNSYMKKFYRWDYETRILKNNGPSYSFSSSFTTIRGHKVSSIKIYPTSPHFSKKEATETANTIIKQKEIFDKEIWRPQ